ncbi:MAG: DUF4157 domain-containing protein [Bacteroidota bacterium]|nr:DUF4157 domain-containing protein [Bacteroidota bacterium]
MMPAKKRLKRPNPDGLQDDLKKGVEHLSGLDIDNVKVNYNSTKPAQLQVHAYAQVGGIHAARSQEKHSPHEAWHIVQQKQRKVKPTVQQHHVTVNNDGALEKEADVMGKKAARKKRTTRH